MHFRSYTLFAWIAAVLLLTPPFSLSAQGLGGGPCLAGPGGCLDFCGDGICALRGESCSSCPSDCGPCGGDDGGGGPTNSCGDGVCDLFEESCELCPTDCGPCSGAGCLPSPPGLAVWYTFDHQSPDGYPDAAGYNFAYAHNGPVVTPGKVSNAVHFDGVDDYLRVLDSDAVDFGTADFSIVLWLRTNSQLGVEHLLSKIAFGGAGDQDNVGYSLRKTSVPGFTMSGGVGFHASATGQTTVSDGEWHLLVVTVDRDQSNGLTLYVDGVPTVSGPAVSQQASISNSVDLIIGAHNPLQSLFFGGYLDELQIYKRVLSLSEINSIYQSDGDGLCRPDAPAFCPGGAACVTDLECGFDPGYGLLGGCYQGTCVCR
ncbi:MAG: LamG domain-containing protein [Acidobacteriota bacterium]